MNITGIYKLILSPLMGVARHAYITQNNKYVMSLQYLKKELSCDVDILQANKEEYLLQVDSIIFHRFGLACRNYRAKFAISLGNLKKEARNEVRNLTALVGSNILLLQFIIHPVFSHH